MLLRLVFNSCQLYPFVKGYKHSMLDSRHCDIVLIVNLKPLLICFLQQIPLDHEPNIWQHVNVHPICPWLTCSYLAHHLAHSIRNIDQMVILQLWMTDKTNKGLSEERR
jgi:hypothetical protein